MREIEGVQPGTLDETVSGATEVGPLPPVAVTEAALTPGPLVYIPGPPLRLCGLCRMWNRKPCGDGCGLSLRNPTWEEAVAREALSPTVNPIQEKT